MYRLGGDDDFPWFLLVIFALAFCPIIFAIGIVKGWW